MSTQDKLVKWKLFDLSGALQSEEERYKKCFLYQFSINNLKNGCDDLGEEITRSNFIGDEFGYTVTTSPLIAYARALENDNWK